MKSRPGLLAALVAFTVAAPAVAQQPAATTPQSQGQTQTPSQIQMQPGPADTAGTGAAPAPMQQGGAMTPGASSKPAAPSTPMAGYAYSDKPPVARAAAVRTRTHTRGPAGPAVNMPGFEPLADGGSRLFVQLSQTVPVEERKAAGSITYVLKGASPRVWNNTNALVTVHFNTPVARARLVPQGRDLLFVVELRAASTPVWKLSDSPDKGVILAIDFAKGDYLDANGQPPTTTAPAAMDAPTARPARGARRGASRSVLPSSAAGPRP